MALQFVLLKPLAAVLSTALVHLGVDYYGVSMVTDRGIPMYD